MPVLRSLRHTARLVLVWLLLSLGAAVASPLVSHQQWDVVCSSSGEMKLVAVGASADDSALPHHLDCPMCLTAHALPGSDVHLAVPHAQPLGRAVQPIVAARLAALVGAPLPPRGPPASV